MIDVIKTIDELNKVIDKLDNVKSSTDINVLVPGIEDAVDDLRTFRDDKQKELDEFESYFDKFKPKDIINVFLNKNKGDYETIKYFIEEHRKGENNE